MDAGGTSKSGRPGRRPKMVNSPIAFSCIVGEFPRRDWRSSNSCS